MCLLSFTQWQKANRHVHVHVLTVSICPSPISLSCVCAWKRQMPAEDGCCNCLASTWLHLRDESLSLEACINCCTFDKAPKWHWLQVPLGHQINLDELWPSVTDWKREKPKKKKTEREGDMWQKKTLLSYTGICFKWVFTCVKYLQMSALLISVGK